MPNKQTKSLPKVIGLIVTVCLVLIIFTANFHMYTPDKYLLVKQFGKIVDVEKGPGARFTMPFVQQVEELPANLIYYDLASSEAYTKDKKSMIVDSYILWEITDPLLFKQTVATVDTANSRLDATIYNAIKSVLGSKTQDELINERAQSDGKLTLDESLLAAIDVSKYGMTPKLIHTRQLDLPEENKEAVYKRMISERNQMSAKYVAEGEEEAQMIRNTVNNQVPVIKSKAQAQADALVAEGEAEYMKILAQAYSTPDRLNFYSFIRRLDALKLTMDTDKTLILPIENDLTKQLLTP